MQNLLQIWRLEFESKIEKNDELDSDKLGKSKEADDNANDGTDRSNIDDYDTFTEPPMTSPVQNQNLNQNQNIFGIKSEDNIPKNKYFIGYLRTNPEFIEQCERELEWWIKIYTWTNNSFIFFL